MKSFILVAIAAASLLIVGSSSSLAQSETPNLQIVTSYSGIAQFVSDTAISVDQAKKKFLIEGTHIAASNGHDFEAIRAPWVTVEEAWDLPGKWYISLSTGSGAGPKHHDDTMIAYGPIAPYTKVTDWHGAYKAVPNAANTAWEPRLTEPGTHHDYELTLLGNIGNMFNTVLAQYRVDSIKATDDQSRSDADLKYVAAAEFYAETQAEARKIAQGLYLGQRVVEAHPAVGYVDQDTTNAVAAVKARWMTTRPDDVADLSGMFQYFNRYLNMKPVELPWEYRVRIANADLSALKVESKGDGSEFAPLAIGTFSPDTLDYSADVPNGVTDLRITPTVAAAGASVAIGGVSVGAGNSLTLQPAVGSNAYTIEVTAIDGETTKTYTLTITRAAS